MKAKLLQPKEAPAIGAEYPHAKRAAPPFPQIAEVGIVFSLGNDLFIDRTPFNAAPAYADRATHEKGHDRYWDELQKAQLVPTLEYDEVPRGRVVYNTKTKEFVLYLDRCISRHSDLVERIIYQMHLPSTTMVAADEHYRCPGCISAGGAAEL
jgi:hypothetical protein